MERSEVFNAKTKAHLMCAIDTNPIPALTVFIKHHSMFIDILLIKAIDVTTYDQYVLQM